MIRNVRIHSNPSDQSWETDVYYVAAFDIGSKNLAVLFEKRHLSGKIETTHFQLDDVRGDIEYNLNEYVDKILPYLKQCHIILIEEQLSKKSPAMCRIEAHLIACLSYLLRDSAPYAEVYVVDSKLKGRQLDCPKGIDLKAWAIAETERELTLQEQKGIWYKFQYLREKAHNSDCKVTIEAFFHHLNLEPRHALAPKEFFDQLPKEKKKTKKFNPYKKHWATKKR